MAKQHSPRFLAIANETKARIHECTIHELKTRMDQGENVTLVDVREDSEFTAGHIPGAIHLSKGIIERDIESVVPDPNQEILLYCGGGFRSALAADNLQRMGCRWWMAKLVRSPLSNRDQVVKVIIPSRKRGDTEGEAIPVPPLPKAMVD